MICPKTAVKTAGYFSEIPIWNAMKFRANIEAKKALRPDLKISFEILTRSVRFLTCEVAAFVSCMSYFCSSMS